MDPSQRIPGDRLVLGMLSAFRTLVLQLSENGSLNLDEYVTPSNKRQLNIGNQVTPTTSPTQFTQSVRIFCHLT